MKGTKYYLLYWKQLKVFYFSTFSRSVILSLTGFGLILSSVLNRIGGGLSFTSKVSYEINMVIYKRNKTNYARTKQTNNSFFKLYRKNLHYVVFEKKEYDYLFKIFTKYIKRIKNSSVFGNLNL